MNYIKINILVLNKANNLEQDHLSPGKPVANSGITTMSEILRDKLFNPSPFQVILFI